MEVKSISLDEYREASAHHRDNFFGSMLWCKASGQGLMPFGIYRKDRVVGTFVLYRYKRLGKVFLINPPLAPHCGLKLTFQREKRYAWHTDVKRAMKAIAGYLRSVFNSANIDFCLPPEYYDAQPFQWEQFLVVPRYTYRLGLSDDEQLLRNMSTERRKNIRDAQAADYELRLNEDADHLLQLVGQSLHGAGVAHHEATLQYLLNHGGEDVYHQVVYREGVPLAAALCSHDDQSTYYLAGGHDHALRDSLAGSFVLWGAMHEAQLSGCTYFDFNGSSVPSIEKYFRGFGPELVPYLRIQRSKGLISWLQKQKIKYSKRA